ncbi:MAG: ABC transporter substrate-binding protein [Dehalococcoidia bacterium]
MTAQTNYWTRNTNRLSRRGLIRGAAVGVTGLAGAALIGCGGDGGADATPGAGTPVTGNPRGGTATGTGTATSGPARRGGSMRVAGQLAGDVPSLDYDRTNASAMGSVTNLAGIKLTQWDERPDTNNPVEDVLPDLAESWETPDEGLTWNFKLRRGAQTSDGLEAKASDVVWSFERNAVMRTPRGLLATNLPDMYTDKKPNATAVDDYTVQVKLKAPDADFLPLMGSHWWTVEHKSVITRDGGAAGKTAEGYGDITGVDQIRGAGPYYPTEYVPASGFKWRRNPNYWDQDIAYLDTIDHPFVLDPAAATAALQAGQLDAFGPLIALTTQQGLDLEKSQSLQVRWNPGMAWNPWIFDMTQPPFNDVRVRRALALSVDRKAWIDNLYSGRGRSRVMVLPWLTYWALDPAQMGEDGHYVNTFDVNEAKQLLQAAGAENVQYNVQAANIGSYTITYPYIDLMASMVAQSGMRQQVQIVDYAAHMGGQTFPDRGIYQSWIVRPDIQSYAYAQVGLGGGTVGGRDVWNELAKQDEQYVAFREVAERQRLVQDRNERRELVYDMQKRMANNVWDFYWPVADSAVVSNRNIHNWNPVPGWNNAGWKYVWREA